VPTVYADVSVAGNDFYDGKASHSYSSGAVNLLDVGEGIAVFRDTVGLGMVQNSRTAKRLRMLMQQRYMADIWQFEYEQGEGEPEEDDFIEPTVECVIVVRTGFDLARKKLSNWVAKPGARDLGTCLIILGYLALRYWLSGRSFADDLANSLQLLSKYTPG